MKPDPTSLSRLNDIVEPPPVSWWPLAPGWYAVLAIAAVVVAALTYRQWRHWRANAYRRAALRELASAHTAAEVSEVLRRAALVVAPRPAVARLSGAAWPAWLAANSPTAFPAELSAALALDVYRDPAAKVDTAALRQQAAEWIRRHQIPETKPSQV